MDGWLDGWMDMDGWIFHSPYCLHHFYFIHHHYCVYHLCHHHHHHYHHHLYHHHHHHYHHYYLYHHSVIIAIVVVIITIVLLIIFIIAFIFIIIMMLKTAIQYPYDYLSKLKFVRNVDDCVVTCNPLRSEIENKLKKLRDEISSASQNEETTLAMQKRAAQEKVHQEVCN